MIRRISLFLILALISLLPVGKRFSATRPEVRASLNSGGGQAQRGDLYAGFLDPPRDYSTMPFWFWNGKMEGPKIQEEIRRMVDQHVYGAFLHARDGLLTPYHSEEWWQAIGAGLEQAKRSGFEFNFVDEYDWPSGEARTSGWPATTRARYWRENRNTE